jgi:hypothetical protein
MVLGFGAGTARWLVLGMAVTAGARRVLMGPTDRGIDVDLPRDQPGRVRPDLQSGQQFAPGAIPLPAAEESVDRLPRSVLLRQIPPRSPRPHPPPNPIDQSPPTQRRPPQHRNRQQRLQHRPLFVREIPSLHTEIITMRNEGQDRLSKTRPSCGGRDRRRQARHSSSPVFVVLRVAGCGLRVAGLLVLLEDSGDHAGATAVPAQHHVMGGVAADVEIAAVAAAVTAVVPALESDDLAGEVVEGP